MHFHTNFGPPTVCEMLVTTFPLVQQFVSRVDSVRSPSEYISLHLYLCKTEWQGRGWVWVGQSYVTPGLIPPLVRQVKLERVCFHFIKLAFGLFTSVLRTFKHPFFLPLQQRERERGGCTNEQRRDTHGALDRKHMCCSVPWEQLHPSLSSFSLVL